MMGNFLQVKLANTVIYELGIKWDGTYVFCAILVYISIFLLLGWIYFNRLLKWSNIIMHGSCSRHA